MASRIEQATVALVTLLDAITSPVVTVTRNSDVPVNFVTESTAVLNVMDGDDSDDSPRILGANIAEYDTDLVVAGYVTANDTDALGPARDALWVAVVKVIAANRVLGSELTWDVRQGSTKRRLESEPGKPVAVFELPVTLRLKAEADDPAVAA